jgi:hypothetical protein
MWYARRFPATASPTSRPPAVWGIGKIAEVWETLMVRLGYPSYGAQGGDWGALITTQIGRNRGHCVAIHTNMPIGGPPKGGTKDPTEEEQDAIDALTYYKTWATSR